MEGMRGEVSVGRGAECLDNGTDFCRDVLEEKKMRKAGFGRKAEGIDEMEEMRGEKGVCRGA